MKFNPDLIRDILIAVSDALVPDEDGNIYPISPKDLVSSELPQYPQNESLYWIRQLMDSDIIIKGPKYIDESMPRIKGLSISGFQFVENTCKTSIWEEVRPQLIGLIISNIPEFIRRSIELGSAIISKCSNIHR